MKQARIKFLFVIAALACLTPWVNSAEALVAGMTFALLMSNPFQALTAKLTRPLLAYSVVGLGFGMNLSVIGKVGLEGIVYTLVGICFTLCLGALLGRGLKTSRGITILISVGTAICGGSAISAVAPTIEAEAEEISVSLATIFLLNAVALILFPWLGRSWQLEETQFGLWCALAIHDTSSVVGAALQFGPRALQIATTVKLARAVWIIPVALLSSFLHSRKNPSARKVSPKRPWFILGFLAAAALVTLFPLLAPLGHQIEGLAKHLLVLTLFFIGASPTRETLKKVGYRPLLLGVILWATVASLSLFAIFRGLINTG